MNFSKVQSEILKFDGNLVINAGAGSGKTRVLVEKYIRIFEENPQFKTDQVVAITFTEKAAREMKDRITHELEERMKRENRELYKRLKREMPFSRISTIHSFCSRIIRESTLYVNLDPDFSVVTSVSARKRIRWVVESYVSEHLEEMKAFFKVNPKLNFEEIISWFEEGVNSRASGKEVAICENIRDIFNKHLNKILEAYRAISFKDSALDFGDLLVTARDLLKNNEEVRKRYAEYFKYIFVDEFQDTNRLQSEIIELLSESSNCVWYIGDPKQSIYSFRGANVDVFLKVVENSSDKGFETKIMNENYRSAPNLVEFYNRFFPTLFGKGKISYVPQLKKGEDSEKRVFLLENELGKNISQARMLEASSISAAVMKFISQGYNFSDIAVLLRDGKSMGYIETSFFENDIPFYTLGGKNFFRRTEVRALYNLLEVVLDPYNLRAMVGFLLSPFVNMGIEEILEMKRSGNLFDVLKERESRVAELLIELNALKNTIDASEIIKIAMERTNFLGKIALERDGDKRVANVLKFIEIVNSLDVPSWDVRGIQRIIDRTLDENESEASELSESENVVRIMTVHRAKGLEFPVVIIGQMAKGGINKSKNEDDEEEKRILYVAMTRAKEYLILSKENSSTSSRKGRWYEFLESSGYIANGEWKVPGEVKDLVEILKLNPLTLTKKEKEEGTDFKLDEMFLENPPVESRKSFFSATELFENFNAEPDPVITARGNIAHSILERVGETTLKVALTERIVLPYPARMIEEVKENLEKLTNDELIREIENASQVKSEFAIEGALPALGINVTGKIDKIVKTDCGYKIIDFKYSYEKDKVSDYEFQVMLYAYLYRKLTDLNVCGVIFFLKDGSKLSVETFDDDKLMEEVKRRVKALQTA